jgi:glucosylceramidase
MMNESVHRIVSSKAGDRLAEKVPLRFEPAGGAAAPGFEIEEGVAHQVIDGFGASFLEAGAIGLNSLAPGDQESVLRALFDPVRGAGFSAMKTPLAGNDFMCAGPWYTYDDTPGDVEMKRFAIDRDRGPCGVLTFLRRARQYGSFALQAPMDFPPDWMLFDVKSNQDVDPKYFDTLALYYLCYLRAYEREGVTIDYLSLFNEPGIYTKIPYAKIRDLLRDHVGPLFEKERVRTKIQFCESENRERAAERFPAVLDDPAARRYVGGLAYHGYDHHRNFDKIAALHAKYPELPLWMTEICHAYIVNTPKTMPLPRTDFEDGDFWGQQIAADLEAGASAWIYWNLILDEKGGPWLVDPVHRNPDDNVQHPVVIVDRKARQAIYTGLYYYMAHFSKFVRPGAVRIGTQGRVEGVRCVAFRGTDGLRVAQLINSRDQDVPVTWEWLGRSVRMTLPAISITTCRWRP